MIEFTNNTNLNYDFSSFLKLTENISRYIILESSSLKKQIVDKNAKKIFEQKFFKRMVKNFNLLFLELILVDSEEIRKMNKDFLNHDYVTDVLSFPMSCEVPFFELGSIVINLELAEEKSKELNHSLLNELLVLYTHAFLHIIGFDHEKDCGGHRELEKILTQMWNPNSLSLIDRTMKISGNKGTLN